MTAQDAPAALLLGHRQEIAARRSLPLIPLRVSLQITSPGCCDGTQASGSRLPSARGPPAARPTSEPAAAPLAALAEAPRLSTSLEDEDEEGSCRSALRRRLRWRRRACHATTASPLVSTTVRGRPARRAAPDVATRSVRCAGLAASSAHEIGVQVHGPDAAPRTRGRPPGTRRRTACRAGRRSARGESAFRSRARPSVAGRRSRRIPR